LEAGIEHTTFRVAITTLSKCTTGQLHTCALLYFIFIYKLIFSFCAYFFFEGGMLVDATTPTLASPRFKNCFIVFLTIIGLGHINGN